MSYGNCFPTLGYAADVSAEHPRSRSEKSPPGYSSRVSDLSEFGPSVAGEWTGDTTDQAYVLVEGSLLSADLSGFTAMSDALAHLGRAGAETVIRTMDAVFTGLLQPVIDAGGDVLHFAGDEVMVLFSGEHHVARAASVGFEMQRSLRRMPAVRLPKGSARLRLSISIASGQVTVARLGVRQHSFVALGRTVTDTCVLEKKASAGEILLSDAAAQHLPEAATVPKLGGGFLLVGEPQKAGRVSSVAAVSPAKEPFLAVPMSLRPALLERTFEGEHRPMAVGFIAVRSLGLDIAQKGDSFVLGQLQRIAAALEGAHQHLGVTWLSCDPMPDGCVFLACSGVPHLHDDDEDRLLKAISEVHALETGLSIASGLNRGRAFAAPIGHPQRRTFSVTGDAVNVAARVMSAAEPGTIVVTAAFAGELQAGWHLVPRAPIRAKGKPHPVEAFEVGVLSDVRAEHRHGQVVGREAELQFLRQIVSEATSGRGAVVSLSGEPGIGKSRLLDELQRELPLRVLKATGDSFSGSIPFSASRQLIRSALSVSPGEEQQEFGTKLKGRLRQVAPHLEGWLPLIAMAAGAEVEETPEVSALDPRYVADRRDDVVAEFLLATIGSPTLVVLEDAHWFDDTSLRLVARLGRECTQAGWVLLFSHRGPPPQALADLKPISLELGPLGSEFAEAVVLEHLGSRGMRDEHLTALLGRAGGNPLFLRELTESFSEGGEFPDRLEKVVGSMIDALPVSHRMALRDVSVLGTQIDVTLLSEVTNFARPGVDVDWVALERFITFDGHPRFRHEMFHSVAYEGLSFRRRRELHARVGAALAERLENDPTRDGAAVVALHFHRAGRHSESWTWSVAAARVARSRGAGIDALALFRQALSALSAVEVESLDRAQVAEECGDVAELVGEPSVAHESYRLSREALRSGWLPAQKVRLLRKHGYICEKAGDYTMSLRWYRRAMSEAQAVPGDRSCWSEGARAAVGYGITLANQGRYKEALRCLEPYSATSETMIEDHALAPLYSLLERIAEETGDPRRPDYEAAAMSAYDRLGDVRGMGLHRLNVGLSAANEGRWEDAIHHYDAARACLERVGHSVGVALVENNKAELLIDRGLPEQARPLLDRVLRIFRSASYSLGEAIVISGMSRIELRAGRTKVAETMLEDAEQRFAALGARPYVLDTLTRKVECLVVEHRPELAEDLLDRLEGATAEMAQFQRAFCERLRACVLSQTGRIDAALESCRRGVSLASHTVPYELAANVALARRIAAESKLADPFPDVDVDGILSRLGVVSLPDLPVSVPRPR